MALTLVILGAIVAMFLGVPVAFSFALAGFLLCGIYDIGITGAISASFSRLSAFAFMALPLFIILGSLMNQGGLARRLIDFVAALVGRKKGGLGVVLILTNTIFGAICGVASSALAAIGGMLIPEMEKKGYPRGYSTGMAISSSVLSLLIPPSTSMIIFGIAAKLPIPLLFMATIIPGLILTILLCIMNNVMVKKIPTIQDLPEISRLERKRLISQTGKKSVFVLFLPVLIFIGIYGGMFTPTEAAAVAVMYAFIIGFFVYKELNLNILWNSLVDAGKMTGSVFVVFFFFLLLSRILVLQNIPNLLVNFLFSISTNRNVLLLMLNIILLFTGMLMDDASGLILAAIIYLPAAQAIGIHPIHFGAICGVNLGMGLITPPVAPLLYLGGIVGGNLELKDYYKVPIYSLLFAYLPVILLTTYVPALSMTIPNFYMKVR
jgi:tripartite ATP-independent transporter DctM subunit